MKKLALIFIIIIAATGWTEAKDVHESIDVNIQSDNGQGEIIIKTSQDDGKPLVIKKKFKTDGKQDVDEIVANILKKHNIKMPPKPPKHPGHTWVKSTDNIDVEVKDNMAIIKIEKNDGGEVTVIEESHSLDGDKDLDQFIDEVLKKHGIDDNQNQGHKIIQIDKQILSNQGRGAYFGFMASVEKDGWHVINVIPDSGADKAGLKDGDTIIAVDGQKTDQDGLQLDALSQQVKVDETVAFKIKRNGHQKTLQVTAGQLSLSDALIPPMPPIPPGIENYEFITHTGDGNSQTHVIFLNKKLSDWLGKNHQLIEVNSGLKTYFGTGKGVLVVNVAENNPLGLVEGDVILKINDEKISTSKQAIKALTAIEPKDGYEIEVMRKKEKISIAS